MDKTGNGTQNHKNNVKSSVKEAAVTEVIVENEDQATEVKAKTIGKGLKVNDLDWGDLSQFGPVLPLGTDMFKNKPVFRFFKRFFDIVLSTFALVVLLPVLLLVALIIFLDDPHGSPIFIQKREGKNRRIFKLIKFRSMVVKRRALLSRIPRILPIR